MEQNNENPKFGTVFKKEFCEQTIKNKHRIIKFVAICFVPFLYGFFCLWAFWNPFINVNKIPMAIASQDANQCIVYKPASDTDQTIANGTEFEYYSVENQGVCLTKAAAKPGKIAQFGGITDNIITGPNYYNQDKNAVEIKVSSITLKLDYLKLPADNFTPQDKYWIQLNIPEDYSAHLTELMLNLKDGSLSEATLYDSISWLLEHQVNIWGTYKQNFLIGYFANEFTGLRKSFIKDAVTQLILPTLYTIVADPNTGVVKQENFEKYLTDIKVIHLTNLVNSLTQDGKLTTAQGKKIITLLKAFGIVRYVAGDYLFKDNSELSRTDYFAQSDKLAGKFSDLGNIIDIPYDVQGYQFNQYGIGLGELFIFIGVWVGTLTQTFVYDRKGRTANAKWYQHYFSKMLLMLTTSWIQTTILMLSLLILGFGAIGPSYLWLWLWILFIGSLFVIIIGSIWMAVKDEMIGRVLVVIYLILNLSAGWGTFPSFMQNGFFNVISYITPFRYGLHNMGTIIYGLTSPTPSGIGNYQLEIMKNFAVLLIWIAVFVLIGGLTTYYRFRKLRYGTLNAKIIFQVIANSPEVVNKPRHIWELKKLTVTEQAIIKDKVLRVIEKREGKI
ncbi:putative ABC transporter [Spiroplasma syrphidicola EA-1]|uniref:Putative ABC transporter n=1 Tax=Spiroplasma syrphidicola EA-1 TaxID=1276229 RepID=R4UCL0_9MOLU|nr:ABC transporter [Spiroplasma syrphidicola]AGM25624.1 putative ABC transporter [Spiroplasma syrphidicola EA-1]